MAEALTPHNLTLPPGHAGLLAALKAAGGAAALARQLGISRFAVIHWKASGIPLKRVPAVSRLTGVSMHDLRPDEFPAPNAAQAPAAAA